MEVVLYFGRMRASGSGDPILGTETVCSISGVVDATDFEWGVRLCLGHPRLSLPKDSLYNILKGVALVEKGGPSRYPRGYQEHSTW